MEGGEATLVETDDMEPERGLTRVGGLSILACPTAAITSLRTRTS